MMCEFSLVLFLDMSLKDISCTKGFTTLVTWDHLVNLLLVSYPYMTIQVTQINGDKLAAFIFALHSHQMA